MVQTGSKESRPRQACHNSTKPSFRARPANLPRARYGVVRDPWFDRLTILSEVEGESREVAENPIILDPGSHPAPRDLAGMTNRDKVSDRGGLSLPRT
jgi:hypothetical protein